MNPEPVIVTGMFAEPASVEDGVAETMEGAGFRSGGGATAVVPAPPQPFMKKIQDKTKERRTPVARVMADVLCKANGI
jgi:hypothetical protein